MLINLTPHEIAIQRPDGTVEDMAPSGTVARLTSEVEPASWIEGIPVVRVLYGRVEGLPVAGDPPRVGVPAPAPGVYYLVSALVLARCHGRADVFAPDTDRGAVRDEAGRIVGTTRLIAAPAF